jgi:glucose/arabinose dehydrogenase
MTKAERERFHMLSLNRKTPPADRERTLEIPAFLGKLPRAHGPSAYKPTEGARKKLQADSHLWRQALHSKDTMISRRFFHVLAVSLPLVACSETANLSVADGTGPSPKLPEPTRSLIPTVNIAPAVGWPAGGKPVAAAGTQVTAFATDFDHPRWIHVLPNGDVLVAETNKPPKPEETGIKAWAMKKVMQRAGAGVPSANRITLLRDADGDGVPELRTTFLDQLDSPFGMALVGNDFYVANAGALVRFPYTPGDTKISAAPVQVVSLPSGINHHWTKNVIADKEGRRLYVTVGSNSNVGENGLEAEVGRAAIWEVEPKSGKSRIFATGLRNPNGMA